MDKISFIDNKTIHRLTHGGGKQQPIARAIGLHRHKNLRVLDATAGLGQDGFLLAHLGATVFMLERVEAVYIALKEALLEAKAQYPETCARITLTHEDANAFMKNNPCHVDVIYLDPIFPEAKKSALNKKNIRALRELVGPDLDADALLINAQKQNPRKIVVKRPKQAPFLNNQAPQQQQIGKSNRFDIYLKGTS